MSEINVSKCSNFNSKNGKCRIPHFKQGIKFTSCYCDQIESCYYIQLQQLKAENEQLRKQLADKHLDFEIEYNRKTEEKGHRVCLEQKLEKAVNLINNIWNITTHLDYTMNKEVANNEIKYIHEITNKYFEQEELKGITKGEN